MAETASPPSDGHWQQEADRLNAEAWEHRVDDMRKAREVALQARDTAQAAGYRRGLAEAQRTIAIASLSLGMHVEAYEAALAAAVLFRELGDRFNEAIVQNTLGAIYDFLGDYESRLQANLRSLTLRREAGDTEGLLRSMNNTADTYTRLGQLGKAMAMFQECWSMLDGSRPMLQAIVLCNIGEVQMLLGDDTQAEQTLKDSLSIAERVDYKGIIVADLIMLGRIASAQGKPALAVERFQRSLLHIDSNTGRNEMADIHAGLADAFEAMGDTVAALRHHRLFHRYQEEHLNERKVKEIRGIQFRQEMEALQSEAQRLEALVKERTAQLEQALAQRQYDLDVEQAVNRFSQSIFDRATVDDVLWDLAKNCISALGFEDAVIYLLDEGRGLLVQKAAYGPKNPIDLDILNPITIPLGQGIVGSVAASGKAEIVHDTSADPRYIIDDDMRCSEVAVPILSGSRVIGVIDSEHREKRFYNDKHLRVLTTIASIVASRIDRIREQEERERIQARLIEQLRENEELQTKVNRELEDKVRERTREIAQAKHRIEAQAKDIRDSISYARSIQDALLPSAGQVRSLFPDVFILYLPRDVVSGDFYWVAKRGEVSYLAVADCTGHGVPGALMSVLGVEKLEQALLLTGSPGEMLTIVNREMKRTLRQSQHGSMTVSRDGMDIALVAMEGGRLRYAGAKRPLWLVRQGELKPLSPSRSPIGGHSADDTVFDDTEIMLQEGDMLYMFTDGYGDQFGGPEGRKFSTARFRDLLLGNAGLPTPRQHRELLAALHQWQAEEGQVDDVLVAGVRV